MHNFRKRTSRLLPALFLALTLMYAGSCSEITEKRHIKLAHGLDVSHPVHKAMVHLAEKADSLSQGRLQVKVYPSQQLGTERQCLELLQIGSLGMTKVSASVLENFAPEIKALTLPYVFRSIKHAHQIYDGEIGQNLLVATEDYWLRGLCYYDAGARSYYTINTPVRTPEDLDGLKVRVQESITAYGMVKAMGAAPTPISWGELYTALQQGVVDGAENNPPSFYTSRHYEVCNYYSLNEHTFVPDVLLINTHLWYKLSDQEQEWLQEAVDMSVQYQRKLWAEAEKEALAAVKEAGVEIIRPDKEPFMEAVQPMLESYKTENPSLYSYIDQIREVGQ